jgi:centromeric protein E
MSGAAQISEQISVAVRVRKPLGREIGAPLLWHTGESGNGQNKEIVSSDGTKKYTFDRVFSPCDDNEVVYEGIGKELIESAVRGVNATIFAYGQTGSGNTRYKIFLSNKC